MSMFSLIFGKSVPKTRRSTLTNLQSFDEGYELGRFEAEYKWMDQLYRLSDAAEGMADQQAVIEAIRSAAAARKPRLRPDKPFEDSTI